VTDKELDRNAARRLAIIRHADEVTGNVAKTCRYYGVSLQYAGAVQTVTHLIVPEYVPRHAAAAVAVQVRAGSRQVYETAMS
jgi:hypothetical protein